MNILYQFHKKRLLFNSNLNKNICRHGHLFKFNLSNKLRYSSTSKKFTKEKKLEAKSIKESLPPKFDDGINNESDDLVLIQKKFGKKPVIFVYFNLYIITFFALYAFNNFSGVFDPRNIEFKVKDLTGYFSNSASDELINEGGKLENKDSEVVKWVQEKLHIEESNLNTLSTVFVAVVFTELFSPSLSYLTMLITPVKATIMTQEEHMVIYDQSQSKHELAVKSLSSLDEEERKRAIRFIKNSVIGNKTKKHLYLNLSITPSLVKYLSENVYDVDLKIQACIIIGSFALDKRNIHSLFQSYLIQPLFLLLSKIEGLRYCSTPSDESIRLAESSGRALKSLFQQPKKVLKLKKSNVNLKFFFNKEDLNYNLKIIFGFVSKEKFNNLIEFVAVNYNLIEIGCSIFARLIAIEGSINGPLNDFLIENELLFLFFQNFLSFLENNNYPKVQEACLDALGSLFLKDRRFVYALLDCKDADYLEVILVLLKHKRSTMRLLAANLITILVKLAPEKFTEKKEISIAVVLTLIKLFKDQNILHSISPNVTVQEKSLEVFSELIIHREDLQEAAMEADAILKLNELLSTSIQLVDECMGTRYTNKIIENSLNAIASVCSLSESCRKQVIDLKLLEKIVISMQNPKKNIRAASCQCTRSLSRSVKNLRTSLVENDISSNLFHLLDDKNLKVLLTCSATICNIVLDFSPMKQKFLEVGGVKKICEILKNEQMNYNFNLKLNLIWCLKNLICHAESSLKFKVVEELGFRVLERLLYDEEVEIREQALSFLRNLVCGKADDIENTFSGFGEQSLIAAMEVKLFETKVKNLQQVLFTLVNIATGTEKHKLSLVNSDSIIPQVVNYLSHENSKVKLGAIWIITNLTWKEEDNGSNVSSAEDTRRLIFKLLKQKNLNIKEKLQVLLNDSNFDVRDRVKTCLLNFTEAEERIEADVVMTDIEYLNP